MNITGTTEERRAQLDLLFKMHRLVEVTFTKVDGTTRVMPCTLHSDLIPKVEVTEGKKTKAPNPNTMSVFCTDKAEWRSFRIDNVIEAKEL
jgi:WYL_2, Sm-like SH3 beta-barrel fold